MRARLLITTMATLAIGAAIATTQAHAAVVAPAGAMQHSVQSLSLTQQVRRVCQSVPRCDLHNGCFMAQECQVTADYPPERTARRQTRRADPAQTESEPQGQSQPQTQQQPDPEPAPQ